MAEQTGHESMGMERKMMYVLKMIVNPSMGFMWLLTSKLNKYIQSSTTSKNVPLIKSTLQPRRREQLGITLHSLLGGLPLVTIGQ